MTQLYGFTGTMNWLQNKIVRFSGKGYIIGTNVEYAVFVEFGTSNMAAQPYLFRAGREVISNAQEIYNQTKDFAQTIYQMALRIQRKAKIYCPVDTGNLMSSIQITEI